MRANVRPGTVWRRLGLTPIEPTAVDAAILGIILPPARWVVACSRVAGAALMETKRDNGARRRALGMLVAINGPCRASDTQIAPELIQSRGPDLLRQTFAQPVLPMPRAGSLQP